MSFIIRDADVIVNGNDLSTNAQAVGVEMTTAVIDLTPIGSRGRVLTQGVLDGVFTVRFLQNLTAVHQILQPLLATATTFPVSISIPGSPTFSMQAEMFRYQPITGTVGEVAGLDVEFVGEITVTDIPVTRVTGVRALATAVAQPGTVTGTGTFSNVLVVGVRALATATVSTAGSVYGAGDYGSGSYGSLGTGSVLITATGVRATATTATSPGSFRFSPTVVGVRAQATATAQPGGVLTGGTGTVIGVRALATTIAQDGAVGMLTGWDGAVPVAGARAAATATGQGGVLGFFGDDWFGDGYFGGSRMAPILPTNHQAPGWGQDLIDWLNQIVAQPKIRSGTYISAGGNGGVGGATQNRLWLAPIIVPSAITVVEANVNVTTGAASNVLRAGIYTDDGNGAPASLVLEFASTFNLATTGTKTQAISQALSAGIYWVGGAIQGGAGANFTVSGAFPATAIVNSGPAASITGKSYYQDGVSGALPSPFTFTLANIAATCPLITLKVQ